MLLKRARAAPAVSSHTDFNGHSLLGSHGRAADAFGVRWGGGGKTVGQLPNFFRCSKS